MAVKYSKGIIVGADTRTSMGTYIPSHITDKLTKLSDKIFVCRSGSAADTQIITKYVQNQLENYSYNENDIPRVKKAAMLAKSIIYNNPSLLAGLIVAGYDDSPKIFDISLGGTIAEKDWTIGGSGSAFIYGYCDLNWKPNMTEEEAINFVKTAVVLAIKRDNVSGGCVRLANITESGVKRYFYPGNFII